MLPNGVGLRTHVYEALVWRGKPPSTEEMASVFKVKQAEVKAALASLRVGKTILVHPETGEIWMAGPFAADPSAYRLSSKRGHWHANCAWDMFGVAMIVDHEVIVDTYCTDCRSPLRLTADPRRANTEDYVVHFLVPARHWYDDIGFT